MSDLQKFGGLSSLFGIELDAPAFELLDPEEDAGSLLKKIESDLKRGNPELAFRSMKSTALPNFTWFIPDTDIKEILGDVIGIRGFIIRPNHGLLFYDGVNKQTLCYSVGAEPHNAPKINGSGVLPRPLYGPGVSKRDSNGEIIKDSQESPDQLLVSWNPYGSRGMSCVECVQKGMHKTVVKDNKGGEQPQSCSGTTNLLFVVMQVALASTNAKTRTQSANWYKVTEIKDNEGNQIYEKPFVLSIGISTSVATAKGKYVVKTQPETPIPNDIQPYSVFLNDTLYQPGRTGTAKGGRVIYNSLVEIWAGSMTEECKKQQKNDAVKCVPVFRLADETGWASLSGTEVTAQQAVDYNSMDTPYVHLAQKVYQDEYLSAGGKLDQYGNPVVQSQILKKADSESLPSAPAPAFPSLQQASKRVTTIETVATETTEATEESLQQAPPKAFNVFKRG